MTKPKQKIRVMAWAVKTGIERVPIKYRNLEPLIFIQKLKPRVEGFAPSEIVPVLITELPRRTKQKKGR